MKKNVLLLIGIIILNFSTSSQITWTPKLSLPGGGRYEPISFTINGKAYVGLGETSTGTKVYDLWEYDPNANTWTRKADYPGAGSYAATAFTINGKGYVCFGQNNSGNVTNDLWEYSPSTNTWKRKANFPGKERYAACAFVIADSAFIGTGSYGNPNDYFNDLWMYLPSTDSWSKKADFPGGKRSVATAFAIGNYGYLGTGISSKAAPTKDIWRYNRSNDSWTAIPNFPGTARDGAVSFVVNNKAYLGTGHDYPNNTNDFYEYDPAINSWSAQIKASSDVKTRHMGIGFSINNIGYFGTGYSDNGPISDLWAFGPAIPKDTIALPNSLLIWCYGDAPIKLDAGSVFVNYLWNTGETTSTIEVKKEGWYKVKVITKEGIQLTDSVEVRINKPAIDLGIDRTICNPEKVVLDAGGQFNSYSWSTPQTPLTGRTITAAKTGIYSVEAINLNGCKARDTILLSFIDKPILDLSRLDTLMCGEYSTALTISSNKNASYSLESTDIRVAINNLTVSVDLGNEGTYPVIITAKDEFSCVTDTAINLGFYKSPVVDLGRDSTICNPEKIKLEAGDQFSAYLWSTGETSPAIEVWNGNNYSVEITDKNGCKAVDSVKIAFTDRPVLDLSKLDTLICGTFTTTLNIFADKKVSYSLESSDPKVIINELTASVNPSDFGTYPVTLTAKDEYSCTTIVNYNLGFYKSPKVGFTVDDKTCSGYNLNVSYVGDADIDVSNFKWDFGGANIADSIGLNSLIVPLGINRSQRDLSLTVTQNGCSTSFTLKHIKVIPNLDLHILDSLGCEPFRAEFLGENTEVVTYDWDYGDGTPVLREGNRAQHIYQKAGFYNVKLRVTTIVPNGEGCYNEVKIDSFVHVAPIPTVGFTPLLDECLDAGSHEISYLGSGKDKDRYIWDLTDFTSQDVIQNPKETSGPLVFDLKNKPQANIGLSVISEYGCLSDRATVLVKRKPVFSISSSSNEGCTPLEVIFSAHIDDAVDQVGYTWDLSDGAIETGDNVKHEYAVPDQQYDIVLTALSSITGCVDSLIKDGFITTYPKPVAAFTPDNEIVYNDMSTVNFTNGSTGALTFSWDFGDDSYSNLTNPSHSFIKTGYRNVLLEAFNDFMCSDTVSHKILVAFNRIFPPNAFSPNAPKLIDREFKLTSEGIKIEGYHLVILNRWSDIVFETKNEIKGWDGKMKNGDYAPAGNYIWKMEFIDFLGRLHHQTGTVTLIL